MVYYLVPVKDGIAEAQSLGDGYSINVRFYQAYPNLETNQIAYNIYYSIKKKDVYNEGVKYISIDGSLEANIINLVPGQEYFFSVRPLEYNIVNNNLSLLPIAYDNLRYLSFSSLAQDIGINDMVIYLNDISGFTPDGYIRVGYEAIMYSSINTSNNSLIVSERQFDGYQSFHNTDGYDGIEFLDPNVYQYIPGEDRTFDKIFACQCRFEYPNFSYTATDGYAQVPIDYLSTDLSASDAANIGFMPYDYQSWHRTDLSQLFGGICVGSYLGGAQGCIDKYGNVNMVRGFNLQTQLENREEMLLSVTGRPACLLQRVQTGIVCTCYQPSSESPDDRCVYCFGSKYVLGFQQYHFPRRSDGRIMVRTYPTDELLKMYEGGLESEDQYTIWTLGVPTIKMRDVLVLFEISGDESWRYEVAAVTRNNTMFGQQGAQIMHVFRVRKTDPIYQIQVFHDTAKYPTLLATSISSSLPAMPAHSHNIVRNESASSNWGQLTSTSMGHNHEVLFINNVLTVMPVLGHTHIITVPTCS